MRVLGGLFGETPLPALRKQIRLVQAAGPYDVDPELTCREVVLTGFFSTIGLYDATTPDQHAEADRLLGQVGLSHVATHAYSTLSSGERVRALIARALVVRPKLLLLDEPTNGLDLLAREQVLATVQRLFEPVGREIAEPPTTLFITHHVEELPPATSQVLLLSEGRPAALGSPDEVLREAVLSPVYGCPLQVRRVGGAVVSRGASRGLGRTSAAVEDAVETRPVSNRATWDLVIQSFARGRVSDLTVWCRATTANAFRSRTVSPQRRVFLCVTRAPEPRRKRVFLCENTKATTNWTTNRFALLRRAGDPAAPA